MFAHLIWYSIDWTRGRAAQAPDDQVIDSTREPKKFEFTLINENDFCLWKTTELSILVWYSAAKKYSATKKRLYPKKYRTAYVIKLL